MKRAVIAAFLATAACAQDRDPPQFTRPVATGAPHTCLQRYPAAAARDGIEGKTLLRFTVGEDGHVKDITVETSSGNAELDQATIDCASEWTYTPATRAGVPFAASWRVSVAWYLHDTFEGPAPETRTNAHFTPPMPLLGEEHGCEISLNFGALRNTRVPLTGPTVVQFTITAEGSTRDFVVSRSAGNDAYDDEAVKCIRIWRYQPASDNGLPVSVRWSATIPWGSARSGQ